jgi:hypothetical protein
LLRRDTDPSTAAASGISIFKEYTVSLPRAMLLWLDHWPGGLKLNTELSSFISSGFLSLLLLWDQRSSPIQASLSPTPRSLIHADSISIPSVILSPLLVPSLPNLLNLLSLSSQTLGASLFLSLTSDLLSLSTLHLYLAYLLATTTFRASKRLLSTLFTVFRGKRVNVLRKRVESAEYGVDQLLLGTVLFVVFRRVLRALPYDRSFSFCLFNAPRGFLDSASCSRRCWRIICALPWCVSLSVVLLPSFSAFVSSLYRQGGVLRS